jgi:hypothetical protein
VVWAKASGAMRTCRNNIFWGTILFFLSFYVCGGEAKSAHFVTDSGLTKLNAELLVKPQSYSDVSDEKRYKNKKKSL